MNFEKSLNALIDNVEKVIVGKRDVVQLSVIALLCKGHLLIEDVPGLGKTMLARSLAKSLNLTFKRIQFTPDLLPSDVTGVSIYNQMEGIFQFKAGPVFTNILLADEINRATPRTQSSLLESMEERQVTVDGAAYELPDVFMVLATQNPIELQGTYPLPEAQLDRFFMKIGIGYPLLEEEVGIMEMQKKDHPIHHISSVTSVEEIRSMQAKVPDVYIEDSVMEYIVMIVDATRKNDDLMLGASPRGSVGLMRAAQAMALLSGMDYVEPSLVKRMAKPVLAHRILLKPQSRLRGVSEEKTIDSILSTIPVPVKH